MNNNLLDLSYLQPLVTAVAESDKKIELVERKLAAIPALSASEVAEIVIRDHLERIKGQPGSDGKDADENAIVQIIIDKYSKFLKGEKGERGEDGKDGLSVDLEAVADTVVTKYRDLLHGKDGADGKDGVDGAPGVDGKSVDLNAVVETVVKDYGMQLRGKDGLDGQDGRDGKDGRDATPHEVFTLLKGCSEFVEATKGENGLDGKDGKDGENGRDGKDGLDGNSVTPDEVVSKLVGLHAETLRGQPGKDGLDGVGIEAVSFKSGEVYRSGTIVIAYIGQHYRAKRDTYDIPGESTAWERIGSWGFRHRGVYSADKQYRDGDLYIKDYGTFAIVAGDPVLLAGRGAKGERGLMGIQGEPGRDGRDGRDGTDIVAAQVEGFKIVLVTQDADHNIDNIELDFGPAILAHLEDMNLKSEQLLSRISALEARLK